MENLKSNSDCQWLTSHFSPENCKWLNENIEGVDQSVRNLLKLTEEVENSASNKKLELVTCGEEFSRMHRALAEKYSNLIGDLCKNLLIFPQVKQPQIPDFASDQATVYHTPYQKKSPSRSEPQPVGFDLFISSGGDTTDISVKDGSESSSSASSYSDSESFSTPMNKHQAPISEDCKKFEAETELVAPEEDGILLKRIADFEEELRVSSEKLRLSEEEVSRLKSELEKDKSVISLMGDLQAEIDSAKSNIAICDEGLEMEKRNFVELQKRVVELENQILDSGCEIGTLEEELKITKEKLVRSEEESTELKNKFMIKISQSQNHQEKLQSQLEASKGEIASLESCIDFEKSQVLHLQEKLLTYAAEINNLHKDNEKSSLEKEKLQSDSDSLLEQKALLEAKIEELELKSKFLEYELKQCKAQKLETTENLEQELKKKSELVDTLNLRYDLMIKDKDLACAEVDMLKGIVCVRANEINKMESNLDVVKLELERAKMLTEGLRLRVDELEKEAYCRAEEKRAAIRELCFTLEHYRTRYQDIRNVYVGQKRRSLFAWWV